MSRGKTFTTSKEELNDLYINQRKSTWEIGKILGFGQSTVRAWMKRYGIAGRPYTENKMPLKKGDKPWWDMKNQTIEARSKRSKSMMGKFVPRVYNGQMTQRRLIVDCAICGNKLKRLVKHVTQNKTKKWFCKECLGVGVSRYWPTKPKEKIICQCDWCGIRLERHRSAFIAHEHHFCGSKCGGKWKQKNVTGEKVYNFKGGYDGYYGDNWGYQRQLCRDRDDNKCNICGKTKEQEGKNIAVDHQIPFEAFKGDYKSANDLSNLWCLCSSCHTKKTCWQFKFGIISKEDWKPLVDDLLKRKYVWQ